MSTARSTRATRTARRSRPRYSIDIDEALRLYNSGYTFRALGAHFGLGESVVRTRLRADPRYTPRRRGQRRSADLAQVVKLHNQGMRLTEIATALGVSITAMETAFDKLGIPRVTTRARSERHLTDEEREELNALWVVIPLNKRQSPDLHSPTAAAFLDRVDALREDGVPIKRIASAIGVSQSALSKWRTWAGRLTPPRSALTTRHDKRVRRIETVPVIHWTFHCTDCGFVDPTTRESEPEAERWGRVHICEPEEEDLTHLGF